MSTHPAGGVVRDAMGLPIEEARRTIRRGAKELPPWIPATPPDELFESAQVIGAFFPRADGLEPAALPRIPGGCQLAFPRCDGDEMSFRTCDPSERVASQSLGIFEAPAHAAPVDPDVLFIPALTVDRQGHRLGRGRGHYDRYLARARPRYTVALVRDALLLDRFPPAWTREWDQPVDAILTESQFLPVRTSL